MCLGCGKKNGDKDRVKIFPKVIIPEPNFHNYDAVSNTTPIKYLIKKTEVSSKKVLENRDNNGDSDSKLFYNQLLSSSSEQFIYSNRSDN